MICTNCGKELQEGTEFCDNCGQKIEVTEYPEPLPLENESKAVIYTSEDKKKIKVAIYMMVIGLVGMFSCIIMSLLPYLNF